MLQFKEWFQYQEQPHAFVKEPITFKLGGMTYKDITTIDPRIERFPDKDLKLRFFSYLIGNKETGQQPQSIYFIDDLKNVFEITPKSEIIQVRTTPPTERVMPSYWWHNAQFMDINHEYIDNLEPSLSASNQARQAASASF